jgi:hypothetical protein
MYGNRITLLSVYTDGVMLEKKKKIRLAGDPGRNASPC